MDYQYRGKKTYSKKELEDIAKKSMSKREMILFLNLPERGTYGYRTLNYFLELYNIDFSHFVGRERARQQAVSKAFSLNDILEGKHPSYSSNSLKKKLIKEKIFEHRCSRCKLEHWQGAPISLDLDHINGVSWDHCLDNLRLLCRNCHAMTETFCGKNTKRINKRKKTVSDNKARSEKNIKETIEKITTSSIDFSKPGWPKKLANHLGKSISSIRPFMENHMPDFFRDKCFKKLDARSGHDPASPASKAGILTS